MEELCHEMPVTGLKRPNTGKDDDDEGSLPCSQRPAISPYHEPDKQSLQIHVLFKIYFNTALISMPGSPKWSLLFTFSGHNHILYIFFTTTMQAMCFPHITLLYMIISERYAEDH
jgi:hypothetical protein